MHCISNNRTQPGFTLIEVLVIAPIVMLLIGTFIALIVNLTGDSLKLRERNVATYDVQDALNEMEMNTVGSLGFFTTTGTLSSPQGKNDSTAAFTSSTSGQPDTLITKSVATTKNPSDPTRALIYTGIGSCNADNPVYQYSTIFFVKNGSLYRRTILDSGAACASPWQRSSCSGAGKTSNPSVCKAEDDRLVDNVADVTIQYFDGSTPTADPTKANTVSIQITVSKQVAGSTLSYSGVVRATSRNSQAVAITQAPASAPAITWTQAPSNPYVTNFQWDSIGNASGYNVDYKIGSGAWTQGPQNTSSLSYSVTGTSRNLSIQLRVTALTSNGNVDYGTSTAYIPSWNECPLQNSWEDYGSPYPTAGYTRALSGIVMLKGLIRNGTVANGTVLCTLPAGFRPDSRLIFQTATSGATAARIDIDTSGNVIAQGGASSSWLSLSTISFMSSGNYPWKTLSGYNSWINYGGGYSDVKIAKDSVGRGYLQGLGKNGTTTSNQIAFGDFSGGYAFTGVNLYGAWDSNPGAMQLNGDYIQTRSNLSNGYWSLQALFYPSGTGSWQNAALTSSWVNYSSGFALASYIKLSDDVVSLQGLIKSGTTTSGTVLFTLPAGYRPAERHICGAVTNPDAYARIDISSNGQVTAHEGTTSGWLSLAGCDFIAEL